MTYNKLKQIMEQNNIPDDVTLMSDSGWECCATKMDGVYYCEEENTVVFTQNVSKYDEYFESNYWRLLYGVDIDGKEFKE